MGLFDLFKGGARKADQPRSPVTKWADKAGDKRAQNYDRQEALTALAELAGPPGEKSKETEQDSARIRAEAVAALLKRFTFNMDPSITDQEEKDTAFNGILRAGELAVEPIRAFAAKAESLAWPMKILKELAGEGEYVEELVVWLSKWDTEYAKFIDPKLQLLIALEGHKHPKIREATEPFLLDVNEPARFHAVATVLAQDDAASVPALVSTLNDEESFRIKNKIAEGLAARAWVIPEELRAEFKKSLPSQFLLDAEGKVVAR
jgi:hypothetical protein